jgi:hypothetical protein
LGKQAHSSKKSSTQGAMPGCGTNQLPASNSGETDPDENQLLLALERELSLEEAAEVEQHIGNCWRCRARSSEMQSGILAFVEYSEKRYFPSLEPPPHDFGNFPGQLNT